MLWTLVLLLGCGQTPGANPAPPMSAPSVLIITLDTTRADRIGVYGGPAPTPAYDRLAAQGTVFERAYSSTPLTIPSHATILTGLGPLSHGVRENGDAVLPDSVTTLAERLQDVGYWTAAFTSAFPTRARWGLTQGFQIVHDDVTGVSTRDDYGDCRRAEDVVTDTIDTLDDAAGKPAMVWVHLFDAHFPYEAPSPWSQEHADPYNAELAYAAAQVERLITRWDTLYPDSVVIITADHGESLGDGGEPTHGLLLNDGTMRVPLIVRGPGITAGARAQEVVGLQDITPTVLGMLGLTNEGLDGVDLRQGGSEEIYAETLTARSMLGIAALRSLTATEGRVTRGVDDRFTPYRDGRVTVEPDTDAALAPWTARLDAWLAAHPEPERETMSLDEETEAALAALGYLGGDLSDATAPIDPRDVVTLVPQVWQVRGMLRAGAVAQALAVVERLERELPGTWAALRPRMELLRAQGRPEEAISVGVDLYRAMPSSLTALDLAELYESMGDLEGVLDWVEEALMLEPHSPRARSLQVRALLHLGDVEAGAELARRWWAEDPHNIELALSLAEVALAEGRLEEADVLSDHALEQLPGSLWARGLRADVDWALGRSEDAIVVMQDLLADNRGDLRVRLRLGMMLLDVHRNAEATRTLRPAAWMAPDNDEVLALVASAEEALASERARRSR